MRNGILENSYVQENFLMSNVKRGLISSDRCGTYSKPPNLRASTFCLR
jgi:hypothetical protein